MKRVSALKLCIFYYDYRYKISFGGVVGEDSISSRMIVNVGEDSISSRMICAGI